MIKRGSYDIQEIDNCWLLSWYDTDHNYHKWSFTTLEAVIEAIGTIDDQREQFNRKQAEKSIASA